MRNDQESVLFRFWQSKNGIISEYSEIRDEEMSQQDYKNHPFTFLQDTVPYYTWAVVKKGMTFKIYRETSPNSSPDSNPLDLCIWNELARKVFENPRSKLQARRCLIPRMWKECTDDTVIMKASGGDKSRLKALIAQRGATADAEIQEAMTLALWNNTFRSHSKHNPFPYNLWILNWV